MEKESTEKKIELCPFCDGIGSIIRPKIIDNFEMVDQFEELECKPCAGSGRVYVTTVINKYYKPFKK